MRVLIIAYDKRNMVNAPFIIESAFLVTPLTKFSQQPGFHDWEVQAVMEAGDFKYWKRYGYSVLLYAERPRIAGAVFPIKELRWTSER